MTTITTVVIIPAVTTSSRRPNSAITSAPMLSSVPRPTGLSRGGSPSAQRSGGRPLARRRVNDNRGCHARADQHTVGHLIDMNAHRDPLGEPDPFEGRIRIDEELGAGEIVAIGNAAGDALDMTAQRRRSTQQINLGLLDRKSTRLNSSHRSLSRMPSSA